MNRLINHPKEMYLLVSFLPQKKIFYPEVQAKIGFSWGLGAQVRHNAGDAGEAVA